MFSSFAVFTNFYESTSQNPPYLRGSVAADFGRTTDFDFVEGWSWFMTSPSNAIKACVSIDHFKTASRLATISYLIAMATEATATTRRDGNAMMTPDLTRKSRIKRSISFARKLRSLGDPIKRRNGDRLADPASIALIVLLVISKRACHRVERTPYGAACIRQVESLRPH
jgi:hypothetical protein